MTDAPDERGRRYPRARRITRGSEIRAIFKRGKRNRTPHLDVLVAGSPGSFARVGLVVPKYGHTAVERNKVRRRLREALRREILPALDERAPVVDVLVRARREAYGVSYAEIAGELKGWVDERWPHSS